MPNKANEVYYIDQDGIINGHYIGKREGTAARDSVDPSANIDGFDYVRKTPHMGKITQDSKDPNFPIEKVTSSEEVDEVIQEFNENSEYSSV